MSGVVFNKDKRFDLALPEGEAAETELARILLDPKVEVKHDNGCVNTGNLFVEFKSRGVDSGVRTSEAGWWAFHYSPVGFLIVDLRALRLIANETARNEPSRVCDGGDDGTSRGVLVRAVDLVPWPKGWRSR